MTFRLFLLGLIYLVTFACSSSPKKGIRVGGDPEKGQASATRAAGDGDKCSEKDDDDDKKKSSKSSSSKSSKKSDDEDDENEDDEDEDEEASLNLLAGETVYKGQVDAIINRACTNCHGGTSPRLENFAQVSASSNGVIDRIKRAAGQAGKMPPANNAQQLSAADIALIEKWVADGKLEVAPPEATPGPSENDDEDEDDKDDDKKNDKKKASDDDDEEDEDEDSERAKKSSKSNCDKSSSASKSDEKSSGDEDRQLLDKGKKGWKVDEDDDFAQLIDTEKLAECHDEGLFFDRRTTDDDPKGVCDEAEWPAEFACTRAGIEKAFGGSATIKEALDNAEKEGFIYYDQCGTMPDGRPVVSLLAPVTSKGEKRLKVRIIREPKGKR